MFNNPVLDVAIGLAFIYVLYSLLATTVKEFVATIFSYRGKMLERGIEQMLDGQNYKYYWWDRIANFFLFQQKAKFEKAQHAKLLDLKLEEASPEITIKTIADLKKRIAANKSISDGVKNMVEKDGGSLDELVEKIILDNAVALEMKKQVIEKTAVTSSLKKQLLSNSNTPPEIKKQISPPISGEAKKQISDSFYSAVTVNSPGMEKDNPHYIKRAKLNKKRNLFATEITGHPLYKRAAENQKALTSSTPSIPSYLIASTFSDILLDILRNPDSPVILLKDIEATIKARAANKNDIFNKDLAKILDMYLKQANGDVQRFKLLIENWYDDMMNRVSGWYKRQANYILLIIGFIIAMAFNVNSIAIVKKLATDKPARDALVQNAQAYVNRHADGLIKNTTDSATVIVDSQVAINPQPASVSNSSNSLKADTSNKAKESKKVKVPPKDVQSDTATKTVSFAEAQNKLKLMDSLYKGIALQNNLLGLGWDSTVVKSTTSTNPLDRITTGLQNIGCIIRQTISHPLTFLGFLITAFAISLGAPFWFDLLNKFINLRVSGAKPDDTTGGQPKTANLNKKPDPTAKG